MADTDKKAEADKQEVARVAAEQKKLRDEQTAKSLSPESPTPTQAENDKMRASKEAADKSAKEVEARTASFYDHPDPTPTQAENDAAMLAAMSQQELPEGSGLMKTPSQVPEDQQRRKLESDKSGGYQTR